MCEPFFGGGLCPVVCFDVGDGDAETIEIFLQTRKPFGVGVGTNELALILHIGGHLGGFSAGGGAGVEDGFAWFGGEKSGGVSGGRVGDVIVAVRHEGGFFFVA